MTLQLFHEVWVNIFCHMEARGHGAMVETMKKQYFHEVAARDGSKLWSAPGDQDWTA